MKKLNLCLTTIAMLVGGAMAPQTAHADDTERFTTYAKTLSADIEASCERMANLRDPHQALEAQFYNRMCMMPKRTLTSTDRDIARNKPIKASSTAHVLKWGLMDINSFRARSHWVVREAGLSLSNLDKFLFAETLKPETEANGFYKNYSHTLVFYLLHKGIDAAQLKSEIKKTPYLIGATQEFLLHKFDKQHERFVEIESMRKSLAPQWGRVFSVGEKALSAFDSDVQVNAPIAAKLRPLGLDLAAGYAPSASDCEAEVFAFQATLADEKRNSPLAKMASVIAMGCASARDDEPMVGAAGLHLSDRGTGFGRYSYAIAATNDYLLAQTDASGQEPLVSPQPPLLGGNTFVSGRAQWGYELASWYPSSGPMKISSVAKVRYQGVPFLLVQGKGQKVKVPIMSCTRVRSGWKLDVAGRITQNNANSCHSVGTKMERIDTNPVLVPIADERYVKKGHWMRFKGEGQVPAKDISGKMGKEHWAFFGAPVLSAKTEKEFAGDETWVSTKDQGENLRAPMPVPPPAKAGAAPKGAPAPARSNAPAKQRTPRRR